MNAPTSLLLLPGLMNDERVWRPVVALLGAGRRVHIAPTHLHDSVQASAPDAIAAMPPGPFAVAGFSLGGYVALEVCRQVPGRIAGLGLLDTGARADAEEARHTRARMVEAIGTGTATLDQLAAGFAPRVVHRSRLQDQELLSLLADMAAAVGSEGFAKQQRAAMDRADSRGMLASVRVPALVLCGRDDQVTPLPLSEEMATLLPHAELVVVDNAGHMTTLEQPRAAGAAVLGWLERVDASAA